MQFWSEINVTNSPFKASWLYNFNARYFGIVNDFIGFAHPFSGRESILSQIEMDSPWKSHSVNNSAQFLS